MFILKILRFWKNKKIKRRKNFEASLTRLISSLLIFLFLSVLVLYYSSIKSMYSDQLDKSNESVIGQVAISFEMIMKQITDGIYKLPLYDTEMLQMIKNNKQNNILYQIELQRKLDSIILGNGYIYSAYLYLPSQNIVYSSEKGNSYPLDNFPDVEAIVKTNKGIISILDPRLVNTIDGNRLLISVICPIPLYQGEYEGLLVVNINANKLYYDVLKKIKADENMNLYVYNRNNTIVINKDASLLFKEFSPKERPMKPGGFLAQIRNIIVAHEVIISSHYSTELNWNFVLETSINSTPTFLTKLYSIGLSLIILLLLGLIILAMIIRFSTRPMKKALSSYNEKLWIDFLTNNAVDADELYTQLESDTAHFIYDTYATILLQLIKTDLPQSAFNQYLAAVRSVTADLKPLYDINVLVIHKNQIAVLVNYAGNSSDAEGEHPLTGLGKLLYGSLSENMRALTYISISSAKACVQLLPAAYKECAEALNFKIYNGDSHLLLYSDIQGTKQILAYEYPHNLEKQLNNNLIVGNTNACLLFLEKFFSTLSNPEYHLSDSEIKNYIYQLQTSILKTISSLPLTIKFDSSMDILDLYDFNEIKTKVSNFIHKIASEIDKNSEDEEFNLWNRILEYIDRKFSDEDFNLNIASDFLNINRNYLTKMVKEKTGYNFNEYITQKRISLAKTLLQDKNAPIEAIARKVGFNYSHYFIKVFKNLEGVTPGQYRDGIAENSDPKSETI